jgi:uncharacterized protein YjbI with pentapeptide repeats
MGSPENRCEFVLTPAEKYRQQEAVEDVQVEQTDDGWKLEVLRDGEWGTESVDEQYWNLKHNPFSCCREAWQDGRCVWHAEVEDKPAADLEAERTDYPERLDCAVLSGTEIRDTIFFRDCSLAFSDCAEADFRESNFSDASLEEANLNNADLRDTDLSHANLWRADLTHANLRNANLAGAELNTAILTNAFFLDANLKNTTLKETNLRDAFLENANLENADLREADLNKANLSFANLARTNLQDADFTNATTNRADLTNAELQRTNLTDASLNRTDLTGANLRKTDLTDASLEAADLSNASFQMANLTDSTLAHSEANRVGFERAVLTQADLFDANLIGARFYATTFDGTKINRGTKFGDASDDGLDEAESVDTEDGDTTLWDKTAWKYRQLHELALDNALPRESPRVPHHSQERPPQGVPRPGWFRRLVALAESLGVVGSLGVRRESPTSHRVLVADHPRVRPAVPVLRRNASRIVPRHSGVRLRPDNDRCAQPPQLGDGRAGEPLLQRRHVHHSRLRRHSACHPCRRDTRHYRVVPRGVVDGPPRVRSWTALDMVSQPYRIVSIAPPTL